MKLDKPVFAIAAGFFLLWLSVLTLVGTLTAALLVYVFIALAWGRGVRGAQRAKRS